jgi:hypothetical protein
VGIRSGLAGLIVVAGAGLIGLGWLLEERGYLSSLLQAIGVTALLVLPLLLFERIFERRIAESERSTEQRVETVRRDVESVERQVANTRHQLGQLQEGLASRLDQAAEADERLSQAAREDVSFESVCQLFQRARELRAISPRGVRVPLHGLWERFRCQLVSEDSADGKNEVIRLSVEAADGTDLGISHKWKSGATPIEALSHLAEGWKRAASYPGDSALNADAVFGWLIETLAIAIESRTKRGVDSQLHPLIERLSKTWVMTDFGLEHLENAYVIRANDLVDEPEHWRRHMLEKRWVKEEDRIAERENSDDFWMISSVAIGFFTFRLSRASSQQVPG